MGASAYIVGILLQNLGPAATSTGTAGELAAERGESIESY